MTFNRLDLVSKIGGDYWFDGPVVGVVEKLSGEIRYVVEDDRGCLHIFRAENLTPRNPVPADDMDANLTDPPGIVKAIDDAIADLANHLDALRFHASIIRNIVHRPSK